MSGFRGFRVLSYGPLRVWGLLRCRVTEENGKEAGNCQGFELYGEGNGRKTMKVKILGPQYGPPILGSSFTYHIS